ncbi:MAG: S9 family peptidase [Acidimicrobiales bacterium]
MNAPSPSPEVAPYGSWSSPITTELITAASVGLGEVFLDGPRIWWSELRPNEAARVALVVDGVDQLPAPWSARTRVHEYGGGAWWVDRGRLYFSNWTDQRLYQLEPGGGTEPRALTPEPPIPAGWRYADGRISPDGRWMICVREAHKADGGEAANEVVVVPADGGTPEVVVSGPDFVAAPRFSADGTRVCWLQWNHPDMPWDRTELWVARFSDGALTQARCVAGQELDEAIVQPEWGPDGLLYFCSDRSNWWNLYRLEADGEGLPVGFPVPLTTLESDIALPAWIFGRSRYAFGSDGTTVVFAFGGGDHVHLGVMDLHDHGWRVVETTLASLEAVRVRPGPAGDELVGVGAGFASEPAVVAISLADGHTRLVRAPRDLDQMIRASQTVSDVDGRNILDGLVSTPEPVRFPSAGGRQAHGWFYPPRNQRYVAPSGELPPLVVLSHGGPTSAANPAFNLGVQYWTTRGFAVLDVDYGGSTGYGRTYRKLLDEAWGIVDVDDCCAGAEWLAADGRCDPARMVIRGGSAGGFTTLAALAFRSTFRAGASHYGVADLEALATDTHKFESRYLDGLVGPYPAARDVYQARSPIHHTDGLDCPLILFQGSEDVIVPPSQSRAMAAALAAKAIPHAYIEFPGEQHGFRQAANIRRALEAELYFYARVFGFELAQPVDPVDIAFAENL